MKKHRLSSVSLQQSKNNPRESMTRAATKVPRAPRADGSKFAREAAAELSRPLPAPPLPLSPSAEKYWPRIIGAKLRSLWTDLDLDTAWSLAEDLGKLEDYRLALQREPNFFTDAKGRIRPHPAIALVEQTERRIQATKRHLQINSAATGGQSRHQQDKNATMRHLAEAITGANTSLIARPQTIQ